MKNACQQVYKYRECAACSRCAVLMLIGAGQECTATNQMEFWRNFGQRHGHGFVIPCCAYENTFMHMLGIGPSLITILLQGLALFL